MLPLTFDQQPHLEPEGATQPVDRRAGVGIEEADVIRGQPAGVLFMLRVLE